MKRVNPVGILIGYVVIGTLAYLGLRALASGLGLPDWFNPFALVVLSLGLVMFVCTAIVQARGPRYFADGPGVEDPDPLPSEQERRDRSRLPHDGETWYGVKSLFTWKNTFAGSIMAGLLLVILAVGWILLLRQEATP